MSIRPRTFLLLAGGMFLAVVIVSVATNPWLTAGPTTSRSDSQTIGPDGYLGAFRVPDGDGSGRGGHGAEYSYGGEVAAAVGDELWISTHAHRQNVGRIRIPDPVRPSAPAAFKELPVAKASAPAVDMTGDLRAAKVQSSDKPMELGDVIAHEGRIHWVFHHFYNVSQTRYRVLGAYDPKSEKAVGPFGLVDVRGRALRDQLTGGYLAAVPKEWVDRIGGTLACGGGGLAGQGDTGAGPNLYVFAPPEPDADPYTTYVPTRPLLLYPFDDDDQPAAPKRSLEGWNRTCRPHDVAWIGDTVVFVACFGLGTVWYGPPDGPNGVKDHFNNSKGFHAEGYELRFLFYNAADLAAVARGETETWRPRPYAAVPVPHIMGHNPQRAHALRVALSWDPATKRLYFVQNRVDHSRSPYSRHPVVHVYDLNGIESPRVWAEILAKQEP